MARGNFPKREAKKPRNRKKELRKVMSSPSLLFPADRVEVVGKRKKSKGDAEQ